MFTAKIYRKSSLEREKSSPEIVKGSPKTIKSSPENLSGNFRINATGF